MLGAYIFIIYVHQLGLGVQWDSNYQHKASLPCLLASQHMCTLWEQILSFSSPSICLTSQKGLSPPHKTSGLGCTLYGSTYLIPRVQVYLCKPSLPFRSVPRGRRPKPMFLSILPSYMVIFIISLVVKEFFQFPISFLCELLHMKIYFWYVYGEVVISLSSYSTILIESCTINLIPTSLIRNVIFIYIWNMLYLKIHRVNVKAKIIVAIFWCIYMVTVNANCISLYTAIIFTA